MKDTAVLKRLLPLLRLYPWAIPTIVIIGMFASIFEGLSISLFVPVLQNLMQETEQPTGSSVLIQTLFQLMQRISAQDRVWVLPALIMGCILVKNILSYSNHVLSGWLQNKVRHQLRSQVFQQLLRVGYDYLETQNSGQLMNTLAGETWRTGEAVAKLIGLITALCTTAVYIVLLLLISPTLTMAIGIVMILISLIVQRVTQYVNSLGQQAVRAHADMSMHMYEGLVGMRTIRAFGREDYEQVKFSRTSQHIQWAFWQLDALSGTVQPLYEILSALLVLTILVLAVRYDRAFLPALLTFLFMLYRLQPQMQLIDKYRTELQALAGSIDDVLSFTDSSNKSYVNTGAMPFQKLQQEICLEEVSFAYPAQTTAAVNRVSLTIPAGKTTALVGPSGAGKTTLNHLICRFYDPSEGVIWVDGRALPSLSLIDWRNRMAIVSQDVHIFNATVAENIAYGRLEATREEIVVAARQAHAHDFICQMPQSYDTSVGDRGLRLSGGQRQRLALARAIVRNPDLLILDEATNALDSISEQLIQEALELFSRDRTVIVIAHRLSTIEQADQIIVLDQGRVAEQGTLTSLLSQNGLFRQMYGLQNPVFTV